MKNVTWYTRTLGGSWTEISANVAENLLLGEWMPEVRSWGMIFAQGCTEIQFRND